MNRIPVIIDCDPGVDDTAALLLACQMPELDIRAVTTVAGNVGLDKTTANAKRVRRVIGADFPIYRGADKPMFRELEKPEVNLPDDLVEPDLQNLELILKQDLLVPALYDALPKSNIPELISEDDDGSMIFILNGNGFDIGGYPSWFPSATSDSSFKALKPAMTSSRII